MTKQKTQFELDCERYDIKPLPGESIGAALFRELQTELKKCMCVPTSRLPKRFQGQGNTTTLASIEAKL